MSFMRRHCSKLPVWQSFTHLATCIIQIRLTPTYVLANSCSGHQLMKKKYRPPRSVRQKSDRPKPVSQSVIRSQIAADTITEASTAQPSPQPPQFPKAMRVKPVSISVSTDRTDELLNVTYVPRSYGCTTVVCGIRWNEEFPPREPAVNWCRGLRAVKAFRL